MKKTSKSSISKVDRILLLLSIVLSSFVGFDTIGKYLLSQFGILQAIAKLINPAATYYAYSTGVWSICLIPVSIVFIVVICILRRKLLTHSKAPLAVISCLLIYQLILLVIALYNYGVGIVER